MNNDINLIINYLDSLINFIEENVGENVTLVVSRI